MEVTFKMHWCQWRGGTRFPKFSSKVVLLGVAMVHFDPLKICSSSCYYHYLQYYYWHINRRNFDCKEMKYNHQGDTPQYWYFMNHGERWRHNTPPNIHNWTFNFQCQWFTSLNPTLHTHQVNKLYNLGDLSHIMMNNVWPKVFCALFI